MRPCGVLDKSYEKDIAIVRTWQHWTILIVTVVALYLLPLLGGSYYLVNLINMLSITIIAVMGLQIVTGYCGLISFGQPAFMAVGAYMAAILTNNLGVNFWLALPLSGIAAGLVGIIGGAPSLRIKGFYLAMAGLTGGRIQTAARASGVMRAALKAAVRYSQDRKVFGAHLGDYQLTQAKLAKMAAQVAVSRCFTYGVGTLLDSGQGQMEASLVKLFACRTAEWVTREALQIHGGMGYAEESPVSRYFVDARVLSIFEGAEETLALKVIARQLLQSSLDAGGDNT